MLHALDLDMLPFVGEALRDLRKVRRLSGFEW
jgi:hypothetical protein